MTVAGTVVGACAHLFVDVDHLAADVGGADAGGSDGPGADADAGGDGAAVPFCAPFGDAAFCDDFDKSKPVERWSNQGVVPGASLALVREQGESFLRGTLASGTGRGQAYLYKDFAATPATRMSFSFRMRTHGYPERDVQTCGIEFRVAATLWVFRLLARRGGFAIFEQRFDPSGLKTHELTKEPVPGAWSRMQLAIAWNEQPARLSVTVDGTPAMSQPSATDIARAPPRVLAAVAFVDPSPAFVIDVDDTLVEVE